MSTLPPRPPPPAPINPFPANEHFNSPVASCPNQQHMRIPCDVESLSVEDTASGRSIKITRAQTKDLAPKEAPARVLAALHRYDGVLEIWSERVQRFSEDGS